MTADDPRLGELEHQIRAGRLGRPGEVADVVVGIPAMSSKWRRPYRSMADVPALTGCKAPSFRAGKPGLRGTRSGRASDRAPPGKCRMHPIVCSM